MRYIFCLASIAFAASCTTSHTVVHVNKKTGSYYGKIAVVYTNDGAELKSWDKDYFSLALKNKFNNLSDRRVRTQLEKALNRYLSSDLTKTVALSPLFEYNEELDFERLEKTIDSLDADAILLVTENHYWETPTYTHTGNITRYEGEPNAQFTAYLVDARTGEIKWVGESVIRGVFAGFDTLNNKLAKKIYKKLSDEGYIYRY
jgi:hypothetical protein